MGADGFAKYGGTKKGRHKGCPRCGAPHNAGMVAVQLSKLGPKGSLSGGGRLASQSKSLCEPCCVAVYEALLAALSEETSRVD